MVKAVLTTTDGQIVQRTFEDLDALTDHIKDNHGVYTAIDAKVIRQGRIRDNRHEGGSFVRDEIMRNEQSAHEGQLRRLSMRTDDRTVARA